jgi:hypothetical protein
MVDPHLQVVTTERDGRWTAHAVHADTGERFGVEVSADSAEAAAARLMEWLDWQSSHMQALAALQSAQRDYHRATTDAAFVSSPQSSATALLEAVEAARRHLDEVRAQRPSV